MVSMITCNRMDQANLEDAHEIIGGFLSEDEYYLESSQAYGHGDASALKQALTLFLAHPDLGFVWVAYEEQKPVGGCVVCYGISTSIGGTVAKLDDVCVRPGQRSGGVGTEMLQQLREELRRLHVLRIDTSVHVRNARARRFYERLGFQPLNEERLSCVL